MGNQPVEGGITGLQQNPMLLPQMGSDDPKTTLSMKAYTPARIEIPHDIRPCLANGNFINVMNVKPFYNSKNYYFLNLPDVGDTNSSLFSLH